MDRRMQNLQIVEHVGPKRLSFRAVRVSGAPLRGRTGVPARQTASIVAREGRKIFNHICTHWCRSDRVCGVMP